jgi:hypothetical protein
MERCGMNIQSPEAIFIELGWLKVSAFGHVAIYALVALAIILLASRLFMTGKRKRNH